LKLLIVAATAIEVKKLTQTLVEEGSVSKLNIFPNLDVDVLVTGIGAVPTAYSIARYADAYDFVLNVGIAGAFTNCVSLGEVVIVAQDCFGDYGIDDNGVFIPLAKTGLLNQNQNFNVSYLSNPWIEKYSFGLSMVNGITLGTASGSECIIERIRQIWSPDIETMECAAVFYTLLKINKPFLCIRAISNMVEPRNRDHWKMNEALNNLNSEVLNFLGKFFVKG
jgi:futalosine hydrolase